MNDLANDLRFIATAMATRGYADDGCQVHIAADIIQAIVDGGSDVKPLPEQLAAVANRISDIMVADRQWRKAVTQELTGGESVSAEEAIRMIKELKGER